MFAVGGVSTPAVQFCFMSRRSLKLCGVAALAVSLGACNFTDPLSGHDNGDGMVLLDALSGWGKNARIVCLTRERSRDSCSSRSAEVYVEDVPDFGQVHAEWRRNDPRTVDVFVFGGTIVRCQPMSRHGDVRIRLWQLGEGPIPSRDGWIPNTTLLFEGQPNRCGASG
jgi:hypothetical protein